ncbi:uncharacterized protein LOC131844593 [Achroia grisella]|uniref:uncharacterized protein LOC131844593 n=1 Tax=Achroia grisella TaxID=688607 RepID=UPI0027D29806|nr:uncharacterized protein LOC131844593 [Achroia grisella]
MGGDLRRRNRKHKKTDRNRLTKYGTSSGTSSASSASESMSSESSDFEKNPGNPFTIHKEKYKQNWLWNHKMDGDHMNVNPFAPEFNSVGPSGADLFFNRKWWYYNQDDYKPMR